MLASTLALLALAQVPALQGPPTPPPSSFYWFDLDGDGDQDALVIEPGGTVRWLANGGAGSFVDVTPGSGLEPVTGARSALLGDWDRDGEEDLVLVGERLWLFRQQAGSFVDATGSAGLAGLGAVTSAGWVDANGDRRPDLHLTTPAGHRVFANEAPGLFRELPLGLPEPAPKTAAPATTQEASSGATAAGATENGASAERRGRSAPPRGAGPVPGAGANRLVTAPTSGGPSGPSSMTGSVGGSGSIGLAFCPSGINDQAVGTCVYTSSVPTLGMLYPLGNEFSIDAVTGNVGVGTTTPNYALEVAGQIVSGTSNTAAGLESALGGGKLNAASGDQSTIAGGESNSATAQGGFVGGGLSNAALSTHAAIAGGVGNRATYRSFVGGGDNNAATGNLSTVAGGKLNEARQSNGFVGGGEANISDAVRAAVVGGTGNSATGTDSFVGGGSNNTASSSSSAVAGGAGNTAAASYGTVVGGNGNTAQGSASFVGGGWGNDASGDYAAVGGGIYNIASGQSSTVAGGGYLYDPLLANRATGLRTFIGGGGDNLASGEAGVVVGGWGNTASGKYSMVLNGFGNEATSRYSNASGRRAKSFHDGTYVWADDTGADFISTGINQYLIRATGGVGIGTGAPDTALHVEGGTNVSATGGGYLQTGPSGGQNVAMDDNEIMARNNGAVAKLALNAEGGNIDMFAAGPGQLGVGTSSPLATLHVEGDALDDPLRVRVAGSTKLILNNAGNLGLGTIAPELKLHIKNGSDVTASGGGYIQLGETGGANLAIDGNEIMARNNGSAATLLLNAEGGNIEMLANGSGNVGIGTDFPLATLHIEENGTGNPLVIRVGGTTRFFVHKTGRVGVATTTPSYLLEVNGTAGKPGGGSWSNSSDRRLKKNIEDLDGALETLLALRGVTFEYKAPEEINELAGIRVGFIAQEVEEVLPDWVDEGSNGMKRLTVRGFEALAVEALRELEHENEELRARVELLEALVHEALTR